MKKIFIPCGEFWRYMGDYGLLF